MVGVTVTQKLVFSGSFGEIMFANWLLPYNEMVAGWVDPWYDAGSASHTNIMGSVGAYTIFYNLGDFGSQTFVSYSAYGGIYNMGFNRRQEEPTIHGFNRKSIIQILL